MFGWGEFVNDGGAIKMLGGAAEIEGGGIYAGTQIVIPVPEPTMTNLIGIGVFFFWRKFQRPNNRTQR